MLQTFLAAFDVGTILEAINYIAVFLTIAIAAMLLLFGVLVKTYRKNSFRNYFKGALSAFVGYIVGILSIFFYLKYAEYDSEGYIDTTFWLVVGLITLAALLAMVGVILWTTKSKYLKLYSKISFGIIGAYALAFVIYRMVLDFQSGEYNVNKQVAMYILTAALVAILLTLTFMFGKKKNVAPTKTIAFAAVTMATSFALSYIRLFALPQGGSITLASLVPIMIFAYMFGMKKALLVGALYGLLQFIQAPWFSHPMQFLLDYPIAFAAIALTALFKELKLFQKLPFVQFLLGALATAIFRYIAHVIAGVFVFGTADSNYSDVAWSFLYNLFVFADMAIAVIAGSLLFTSKTFMHQLTLTLSGLDAVKTEKTTKNLDEKQD